MISRRTRTYSDNDDDNNDYGDYDNVIANGEGVMMVTTIMLMKTLRAKR